MNEMDGVSKPAKVNEGPIESVLAVRPMIDGYEYVTTSPSLPGLSVKA